MGSHEGFTGFLHDRKNGGGTVDDQLAGHGRAGDSETENGRGENLAKGHCDPPKGFTAKFGSSVCPRAVSGNLLHRLQDSTGNVTVV